MRSILPGNHERVPDHIGLAYDTWAPVGVGGKVGDDIRLDWLSSLAEMEISSDYAHFYEQWKGSFGRTGDLLSTLTLRSRLLVGHGNSSATDVGLTVHHTWGVPMIPGSAIKGLLAHYVDAVYGPDDPSLAPWEQADGQTDRARFQGVTWRKRRILRGPGDVYRALFGAPDAEEDSAAREAGYAAGASAGLVTFHDALYVPNSPNSVDANRPYVADVLTVHQKTYYDNRGATWPNDHDDPNPVSFLTVRPGVKLLLALSGPPDWTELAGSLLADALAEWGVGAKTSAGYGVGEVLRWNTPRPPLKPPSESLQQFLDWLKNPPPDDSGSKLTQRQILAKIEQNWWTILSALPAQERSRAASAIGRKIKSPKLKKQQMDLQRRLTEIGS